MKNSRNNIDKLKELQINNRNNRSKKAKKRNVVLVKVPTQEELLKVLDVFGRICRYEECNYIDSEFANGTKFYVDGCVEFQSREEKELIQNWILYVNQIGQTNAATTTEAEAEAEEFNHK